MDIKKKMAGEVFICKLSHLFPDPRQIPESEMDKFAIFLSAQSEEETLPEWRNLRKQ